MARELASNRGQGGVRGYNCDSYISPQTLRSKSSGWRGVSSAQISALVNQHTKTVSGIEPLHDYEGVYPQIAGRWQSLPEVRLAPACQDFPCRREPDPASRGEGDTKLGHVL
jgi:hypothetical protein